MKNYFLIVLSILLFSCKPTHKNRNAKIHCYHTGSLDDNTFLYWYILFGQNNTYYVYSSSTPVTNFSNASWTQESSLPSQVSNIFESGTIEEPLTELPNEIEVDMANEPNETTESSQTESTESSTESSGESSSGDSGGSSGGDGGGGD